MKNLLLEGIEILRRGDIDIDRLLAPRCAEAVSLLERYLKEIELFNPAYGLVAANDPEELIIKHILDSLAPLGIISRLLTKTGAENTPLIADAGSGAGLPGIPLAIALPEYNFTLIERMGRRAGFLWNTKAALGLSNITVEEKEFEKTAPGRFALVTFRAFKSLETKLAAALFNACAEGGVIAAYKGRREKAEQEMAALENLRGKWEIAACPVPFLDEERHLLIIKTQ